MSGGGGGDNYYEALNELYGIQAQQARDLSGVARRSVLPAYERFLSEAENYDTNANRERAATQAGADTQAALGQARQGLSEQLASVGIDPGDTRYAKAFSQMETQGAAQKAAGMTGARERISNVGFARMQDALSPGFGLSSNATAAANAAGQTAYQGANFQQQQAGQYTNAVADLARTGMNVWGGNYFGNRPGGARGGLVRHLAGGGVVGTGGITPPPPIRRGAAVPYGDYGMTMSSPAAGKGVGYMGAGLQKMGDMTGSAGLSQFGEGMQNPSFGPAQQAIEKAMSASVPEYYGGVTAVNPASPYAGAEAMGAYGAAQGGEALGTVGAATAAEEAAALGGTLATETGAATTAAATGATVAGSAAAAAVPVIGWGLAAYGAGKALGLFADGGPVTPNSRGRSGLVDGPGGPRDDLVPVMLSDDEFVMPASAVRHYGLDTMERMRQTGLASERRSGLRRG